MFYDDGFDVTNTVDMCDALLEKRENGSTDEFEEALLFYLCGACELLKAAEFFEVPGMDLSEESWGPAISVDVIVHSCNLHNDMDEEDSKAVVIAMLAGYFLFMFYNSLLDNGNCPSLLLDEESGNIILCDETEDGQIMEYDVMSEMDDFSDSIVFETHDDGVSVSIPIDELLDGFRMAFAV